MAPTETPGPELDLPADMFRNGDQPEPVSVAMWRRMINDTQNAPASFTEIDGLAIMEGDILLGPADQVRNRPPTDRGLGIIGEEFRWLEGIVPYVAIDEVRDRVDAAVQHWEQRTPFRFVERTDQNDFISFESRGGCFSNVGRQMGMQVISLGPGCGIGSAIHEIGHALGLWHEQSRSDRDEFIEIVFQNISPQHRHNFDKHVLDGKDLGNYDFGSIMHYPATAFSINGQPTIRVKDGQPIGQRNGLSADDVAAVKLMYPKLDWDAVGRTADSAQE